MSFLFFFIFTPSVILYVILSLPYIGAFQDQIKVIHSVYLAILESGVKISIRLKVLGKSVGLCKTTK